MYDVLYFIKRYHLRNTDEITSKHPKYNFTLVTLYISPLINGLNVTSELSSAWLPSGGCLARQPNFSVRDGTGSTEDN